MLRGSTIAMGVLFAGIGAFGFTHQAAGQEEGWITLTDGTSLENFDQAGNANWRIAERTIAADRGTGFLVTKQSYDNFRLRAEFWVDEDANSGIFIRCDNPQQPSAASCYEINIFDSNPNRGNATGAIVNLARVDPAPQTALKWNVLEIEAKGPQLNVMVNGERTASVQDTRHARGRIALQRSAGVVRWHKVEIQPLSAEDLAADAAGPIYANCRYGFAVIFPGGSQQPLARDIRYTLGGVEYPAREVYVERGPNRYSVTVIDFPSGPRSDEGVVEQAAAELSKKGEVRFRAWGDYDPGMRGTQLNIFQPDGRQIRASVYMANRRLTITEADATVGDTDALLFEQSITLIDRNGTDIDRVNNQNEAPRKFDCREPPRI